MLANHLIRGLVQIQGNIQGGHGHGLEKAVKQGVQKEQRRGLGDAGA